ncbi:PAS domain-containing protein [Paucibacter sp. PLA-PC-4]|uniref:chemotaxis protein CheB n=1 Tax=Paucibacter sp. PLA-PC-4 TaxID=2993655 RepID=UPI002249910D|nr:chemotaxis protein CheB [Paucibacter sp. PLA-PC-4]MCX2861047.1 PAS domain-containing protein [Paucibacter sp. PLA-PC-4]
MSPSDVVPTSPPQSAAVCPRIVGLGASAGGLVALEQFLAQVPARSGLAYIVVQHLDPTQKALLPELLQRVTVLPVRQAQAQQLIVPDSVYVIGPNTELSVAGGRLQLAPPSEPRGLRLPVDVLFSSLAREQGRQAIAVVLSGMGADGTLGLQAVHAVGGLGAAQAPETAQFDAMPKSAIATGCVTLVEPPQALPGRILSWLACEPASAAQPGDLQRIFGLLRQRTGHDFSLYKPSTLHRRIERRMAIHALTSMAGYADFLSENPQEVELLFKELLIGVTRFFRDGPVWQQLAEQTLPELLARRAGQTQLRAWVVGCSTGEEAYSLAIVFAEVVQRLPQHRSCSLQIFASDLSPDAIGSARRGQYPAALREQISPQRLARFFTVHEGGYRIGKSIRDSVLFAQHDVLLDPPFTKLDLLCCRNLMIYFDAALQRRLLPLFHYSLRPGGVLLLGSSETVGRFTHLFGAIDSKLRLYLRQDHAVAGSEFMMTSFPPLTKLSQESVLSSSQSPAAGPENPESLQVAADHLLLQVHAPPAVVVSPAGDIVYISGRTGKYLEPASGKANWNFHAMVREGLRAPVSEALRQVVLQDEPVLLRGLHLPAMPGVQTVDVTVQAVREPGVLQGMVMIVFRDVAALPAGRGRRKTPPVPDVSAELQQCRDEIQALREEARATKEELQSANEELQSTNEELQSANEELTTSKEEMQSMNEELQTVNAEMQTKLDDLALAQSDMRNLLNSTDIAMLFLDQGLNVRRFTERASKLINLRDSDIGRPLSDLTTSLQYPDLHEDAHETLRTLVFSEKQILSSDQRWFSVRIMPYRRLDNVIDGAVITFVDITATKELEARLRLASKA